jgi:signal transduction histidine kinase
MTSEPSIPVHKIVSDAPDLLVQMLDRLDDGVFILDETLGSVEYVSDGGRRFWEGRVPTPDEVRRAIVPDDRPALSEALAALHSTGQADVDLRYRPPTSGAIRWVRLRLCGVFCEQAQVRKVAGIATDVTARHEREKALVQSRDAARTAAETKDAILANLSHEVRTPLTAILSGAELLTARLSEEEQEFARIIQRNGRRLLDTMTSILEMAELEAGQYDAGRPDRVDLRAELHRVADDLEPLASQKPRDVEVEDGPPLFVRVEPAALQRILTNLVENAVKYTGDGWVRLGLDTDGPHARVHVEDTGPGIPEAEQEAIFHPFGQASMGRNRTAEGSGLGLSIATALAKKLGGSIDLDSTVGEGSRFTLSLPLRPEGGA